MFHRFHITLASLMLALALCANSAQGAVSYLLIQGEFNALSAGDETYKWKVNYTGSSLITGQDLLFAVFGAPVLVSGISYMSGNTTHGVSTLYFDGFGYSPQQFFNNGFAGEISSDDAPYPYWNYYAAGGDGDSGDVFANGTWTFAENDGALSRQLVDGSFDAWTYGEYQTAPVSGSGNSPTIGDFTGAETLIGSGTGFTVYSIAAAPEPSRGILLVLAGIALISRRRRPVCSTR